MKNKKVQVENSLANYNRNEIFIKNKIDNLQASIENNDLLPILDEKIQEVIMYR